MTIARCRACGKPIEPARRGGPRLYCVGGVCRRRAEFAVRRIDRLQAEVDRLTVRLEEERAGVNSYGGTRNHVAELEKQIQFRRDRIQAIAGEVGLAEVVT